MNDDLADLIASREPALTLAYLRAVGLLRDGIDMDALVAALDARDVDAALRALDLEPAAFNAYVIERQSAYAEAGEVVATALTRQRAAAFQAPRRPTLTAPAALSEPSGPTIPPRPPALSFDGPEPTPIVFRFDMTNPRAEARIRTEAAARVAGYVEEQAEVARRVIGDGFQRGDGPQQIATDIVGRVNPISGRREGGIVGLSDPQTRYVDSMRQRLLSGDADEMLKVLGRFDNDGKWIEGTGMTLRDRRFDRSIRKAIRDVASGKPNPLSRDKIDEMAAKYSDRLLARRAEDIARTETASGVEMARAESSRQALDKAGLPSAALTKHWYHQGGVEDARQQHLVMHNKEVIGVDTHFVLPDGTMMLYPHDPAGGAKHNVNCRCRGDQLIDWAYGL